eukprot:scaffold460622_cov26-Prasinocladus_malaysianus.AAC.1
MEASSGDNSATRCSASSMRASRAVAGCRPSLARLWAAMARDRGLYCSALCSAWLSKTAKAASRSSSTEEGCREKQTNACIVTVPSSRPRALWKGSLYGVRGRSKAMYDRPYLRFQLVIESKQVHSMRHSGES